MSSPSPLITQPDDYTPHMGNAAIEHGAYRIGLAYGRQIYRMRWLILILWLAGLLAGIPFAAKLSSVLQSGGYTYSGSQAASADQILINKLHWPSSQALVVFQSSSVPVSNPGFTDEVTGFMDRAKAFPDVTGVSQGAVGIDGRTTYVTVDFSQDASVMQSSMAPFRSLLPTSGPAQPYLSGDPETYVEYNTITQQDIEHAESVTLPIALVVLVRSEEH